MTVQEFVSSNLGLILGALALIVFGIGLFFAMRTEQGRNTLAKGAVSVALAALALAERWIAEQLKQEQAAALASGDTAAQENEIETARRWLQNWQARR